MSNKVVFIHPDLGIGGAERLIVDAALALKSNGHSVCILTSHHDHSHCFDETKNGTLPVFVHGDWIPRSVFGKCKAFMAYIRMMYVALCFTICQSYKADLVFVDVISVIIPIVKWKCPRVIYYCHFPDQLLSEPGGYFKEVYRMPLNWLEEVTVKQATKVFVNSKFTAGVFASTFNSVESAPEVLYPSLPTAKFDMLKTTTTAGELEEIFNGYSSVFISINRYERKKNISLAIQAFEILKSRLLINQWDKCFLIIAGGYDPQNEENILYYEELKNLVKDLQLQEKILLLKSPTDATKIFLIQKALSLIYTPSNEHFGIVPLEAMYLGTPVIASNSGGPKETIVDGKSGYLCDSTPGGFANAMEKLIQEPQLTDKMGKAGRQRVIEHFSFESFMKQLNTAVCDIITGN